MRDRPYLTTARTARRLAGAASSLVIAAMIGLTSGGDAFARARVTVDETVLESLGPEPSIASQMLRSTRIQKNPSLQDSRAPASRAIAQAPAQAPRSRLLLPGGAPQNASPAPQLAMAPMLRLPPMAAATPPTVRPAPAEAPRSRLTAAPTLQLAAPRSTPPSLTPPSLTPPAQPAPQLALAPPIASYVAPAPALLPTPPVAPASSGVRAAPAAAPRSQLLLPPALGERPAPVPTPAPAPVASTPWPSLAGAAVAAPLPPSLATPPAPTAAPPARQVAAAPTARDIQPPAPTSVPAVAPSAAPSSSSTRPGTLGPGTPGPGTLGAGTIGARLLFQRGTLDPADGSREALSRLAAQLSATPNRRVQIMAYALGGANEAENSNEARRLSLDRALAVRSGLVQQGVRSTQVTVRALGNPGGEGPPDRVDILLLDE